MTLGGEWVARWRAALPGAGTEVNRLVGPAVLVAFGCHRVSPYTWMGIAVQLGLGTREVRKCRADVHHLEPGPGQDRSPPDGREKAERKIRLVPPLDLHASHTLRSGWYPGAQGLQRVAEPGNDFALAFRAANGQIEATETGCGTTPIVSAQRPLSSMRATRPITR